MPLNFDLLISNNNVVHALFIAWMENRNRLFLLPFLSTIEATDEP